MQGDSGSGKGRESRDDISSYPAPDRDSVAFSPAVCQCYNSTVKLRVPYKQTKKLRPHEHPSRTHRTPHDRLPDPDNGPANAESGGPQARGGIKKEVDPGGLGMRLLVVLVRWGGRYRCGVG